MIKESFWMSWQNIISNKMRSFLTILGIIIGVLSIITIVTVINGASERVSMEFENLGAGKISVTAKGTPLKRGLSANDIDKISSTDNVFGVSPSVKFKSTVVKDNIRQEDVNIDGKNDYYFRQNSDEVILGRGFNYLDVKSQNKVCVIDKDVEEKLFLGENPIGKTIVVNSTSLTVVGVLDESSSDLMSQLSFDSGSDYTIMIPYTTAMKMTNNYHINYLDVYLKDASCKDQVTNDIQKVLNEAFNYKEDSFAIFNLDSLMDTMKTITTLLSSLLGGIASIALLVGGIGIMNMMLVSVTERTKEIGLKKALGAEPKRIQLQFLIESVVLSLIGGLIGLLLGLLISWLICLSLDMPFVVSINAVLLAVGFSTAVGIIFGWVPARKASMLNPIDALRSE